MKNLFPRLNVNVPRSLRQVARDVVRAAGALDRVLDEADVIKRAVAEAKAAAVPSFRILLFLLLQLFV